MLQGEHPARREERAEDALSDASIFPFDDQIGLPAMRPVTIPVMAAKM